MRVISGRLGGRRIHSPESEQTRPSSQRIRTALFDRLGARIEGARVLDLYAGSGALGIEALSRGAAHGVFVERSRAALAALRRNLGELELVGCSRVLSEDVERALERLRREGARFEIVLMDPPYRFGASDPPDRRRAAPGAVAGASMPGAGSDAGSGSGSVARQGAAARGTPGWKRETEVSSGADRVRRDPRRPSGPGVRAGRPASRVPPAALLADLVAPAGCLVAERSRRDPVWELDGWILEESREHGETRLDCYEREGPAPEFTIAEGSGE